LHAWRPVFAALWLFCPIKVATRIPLIGNPIPCRVRWGFFTNLIDSDRDHGDRKQMRPNVVTVNGNDAGDAAASSRAAAIALGSCVSADAMS
jgi:hypothetical protein